MSQRKILGVAVSEVAYRRWLNFKANRRGYRSFWIFLVIFVFSLGAELIANDKPIMVSYKGELYAPFFNTYVETTFGGEFETEADYRDPFVQDLINAEGWLLWPVIPFSYNTIDYELDNSPPTRPDARHWLGTDDQGRDVLARAIYGFRISVVFALVLTVISSLIGIAVGAFQGYFGGRVDLYGQRVIEVWQGLPQLYILIIMSSLFIPGFWTLAGVMILFSWTGLVGVVRAEFLRARNFDYVRAARALGVTDRIIMWRHVLPNALVATMTFLPFILTGAVTTLTSLDFLGLGLPSGSPSLGEMVGQGKRNLQSPWLGMTAFVVLAGMLSLLMFCGEALRDAFDPRKGGH